jgi:hypothetical protein
LPVPVLDWSGPAVCVEQWSSSLRAAKNREELVLFLYNGQGTLLSTGIAKDSNRFQSAC